MKSSRTNRRQFLATSSLATIALGLNQYARAAGKEKLSFKISLAQWTINRELRSGEVDNLDFAKVAHEHGIQAVEYVNQFFMDKAKDKAYLAEMKKRAADLDVKSLIIM